MGSVVPPVLAGATPAARHYTVRRATAADRDRVIAFYERHFPQHTRLTRGRYWDWQFLDQPTADGQVPFFVLEDGGEVQGGIGYIGRQAHVGGKPVNVRVPICYFVADAYRGLPSLMLLRAVMADADVMLASSFSEEAYKLVTKAGFKDVGGSLRYYWSPARLTSANAFAASRYLLKWSIRAWRRVRALFRLRRLSYRIERSVAADMSAACIASPGEQRLHKTPDWMAWRYNASPLLEPRFVHQYERGEPVGLAVINVAAARRSVEILDLWWRDRGSTRLSALLEEVRRVARRMNCDEVMSHALGDGPGRAFARSLFSVSPSSLGFLVMCRRKDLEPFALRMADWSVLVGDTDSV